MVSQAYHNLFLSTSSQLLGRVVSLAYNKMRKELFEEGEFYHIYNRGVDKRPIFTDDKDKLRFVNTLYLVNNFVSIPYRFNILSLEPRNLLVSIKPPVEIAAGCIMSNHFHLVLSPRDKGGISRFLQRVGTSYTKYFNSRKERSGRLFESVFKAKHIDRHEYVSYLTQYIHLNPVGLFQNMSRGEEILEQVENYPWSTLPDYLDKKSHLSLLLSGSFRDRVLDMKAEEYRGILHDLYMEKIDK